MKYLLAFLFAFVALVSAAAVDPDLAKFERDLDEVMAEGNIEIFSIAQDNNSLEKLVILVDGQFEGTIVQTDEFTIKAYDAEGNEISMDDLLDEDNDEIEKRWIGVAARVLRMLAPVIKRWGNKALKFFKCVGLDANLITCSMKFSNCATMGVAPWKCVGGITCMGKVGKNCAKKF